MKSPDTALKLLALALLGAVVAASSTLLGADIFTDTNEFEAAFSCLARIMHKFSTASPKSLVLTVLRVTRLVRPAVSALRDENLCIIRAS